MGELVAVTGAGRGIGLASVLEFARRGSDVLALTETLDMVGQVIESAGKAGLGYRVTAQQLDVTDPGAFAFPSELRVLVNNAGIRRAYLPVEHAPQEDWHSVFEVNVFGLVEMCRRAIPRLRANGGGAICNVGSSAAVDFTPFLGVYRTSKAAVSALCETLRLELAPFGIRVVEILPGPTRTVMASDGVVTRLAEAGDYPEYLPMALRQREIYARAGGHTEVEVAAKALVDAVQDTAGPMRYATDEISAGRLAEWRENTDEQYMAAGLARYGLAGGRP
jgi:NAD(P)-dependent dehydrogenase (short-subunit alcohol dehydrogenase family)